MKFPADVRAKCDRMVERRLSEFVAPALSSSHLAMSEGESEDPLLPTLKVTLQPPTQKAAEQDFGRVREFVAAWDGNPCVEWAERNWSRSGLGRQRIPVQLGLDMDQIVAMAGRGREIAGLRAAVARLAAVTEDPAFGVNVVKTVKQWRHADPERLARVCEWALAHPGNDRPLRQWDVPGVDTKFIERNLGAVKALVGAPAAAIRAVRVAIKLLDPALQPVGGSLPTYLRELEVSAAAAAKMFHGHVNVVLVENQATFWELPPAAPGSNVVAVWGRGYSAGEILAALPWPGTVVVWGDMDADGFAIVNEIRSRNPQALTACMDLGTWEEFAQFRVDTDGASASRVLPHLTEEERIAFRAVGTRRVEQERIPMIYAMEQIGRLLGHAWPAP